MCTVHFAKKSTPSSYAYKYFKYICKYFKVYSYTNMHLYVNTDLYSLLRQNCSVWTFNFMFEMFVLSLSALAGNFDDPGVNYKVKYI